MKFSLVSILLAIISLAACKERGNEATEGNKVTTVTDAETPGTNGADGSIKPVIANYLKLKNALAADNSKDAANAANALLTAINSVDTTAIPQTQKPNYAALVEDMREHAEHTVSNAKTIAHQREHFEMLSKDVYDLIKTFGGNQTLYYTHCPMAFNEKGAYWIS
ncbi:MAG: DUF3347 domain-containing protein, partial [Moraxellaceae bacterium]